MKIPTTLKAFGRKYQVEREDEVTGKLECWGYLDAYRDILVLRRRGPEFTPGHEKQVFLHELLHIIDTNFHINLSEDQIQIISVTLNAIIEDNHLDFTNDK